MPSSSRKTKSERKRSRKLHKVEKEAAAVSGKGNQDGKKPAPDRAPNNSAVRIKLLFRR